MEYLISFAVGAAAALAFAILWLNHNFKSRPEWVFAKLAAYRKEFDAGLAQARAAAAAAADGAASLFSVELHRA